MPRLIRAFPAAGFFAALLLAAPVFSAAPPAISAAEECAQSGGSCGASAPGSRAPLPELSSNFVLVWENGQANLVNGWTSERNTSVNGTGGPEGDHGSTIADDFQVPAGMGPLSFYVCFFTTPNITTAEMYLWANAAGSPQLPVTSPLVGAPTTPSIVTTTYLDNTSYCPNAFGIIGRLFVFTPQTTGQIVQLPAGTYWLGVVGEDAGSGRAFWATSSPATPLSRSRIGSTFFGFSYWTDMNVLSSDPAQYNSSFRVLGEVSAQAIPTLGSWGILALAVGLALAALGLLRFRR